MFGLRLSLLAENVIRRPNGNAILIESAKEMNGMPNLTRDLEKGWVLEENNRIITFRVQTFQDFADRLRDVAGNAVARILLDQMGRAIGEAAMKYSRKEINTQNDLWRVLDRVLALRGWGRCLGMEEKNRNGRTLYIFRMKDSPQSHERRAAEPTCHILRGVVEGWLSFYLEKIAAHTTELECASMGAQFCVFEIAFQD